MLLPILEQSWDRARTAWEKFGSAAVRGVVGYRAASEFPNADIADIGNADDERLSSCGVAAGGVH